MRHLRASDAPTLLAMLSTEEVARFISPPPTTVRGFEHFIEWTHEQQAAGRYICFGIVPYGEEHALRLRDWLRHGPPVLLFFDLNTAGELERELLAKALVRFQTNPDYGKAGHRCVVTYRSATRDGVATTLEGAPILRLRGANPTPGGLRSTDSTSAEPSNRRSTSKRSRNLVPLPRAKASSTNKLVLSAFFGPPIMPG